MDLKVPEHLTGVIHRYHDRFLADDSLTDLHVLLLCIYLLEENTGKSGATHDRVKEAFVSLGRKERPNFGVTIHNAKKRSLIEEKNNTLYLLIKGLKEIRNVLGQIGKAPVHLIKAGGNFTAIKLFEEFLAAEIEGKEIFLCDSHISHVTLYPLAVLKGKTNTIKILTSNIHDSEKFKEYRKKFERETGITVEVKVNNRIHDRYLISDAECWVFGGSIKDLGNKDSLIRQMSEVSVSLKQLFDERWSEVSTLTT